MSNRTLTTSFLATARVPTPSGEWAYAVPPADRPSIRAMLRAAWRRHQSRVALARLDGYLLKDIGVSFSEAEHEANKPFWRC
ncbi:MAG TPA: DUF1127 domain-containing protein [Acetobacteraceae bacterium]|nr:DUF1127 domain-containing protein [Acetobacteraceae bacterium]